MALAGGVVLVVWLLAILVGLTGTWVYDDVYLADTTREWGFDDVAKVVLRTSDQYQDDVGTGHASNTHARTYRPVTMLTLMLVHAISPTPIAHHLVSAAMHLAVALLLATAIRRWYPSASSRMAAVAGAVFLLHPANVEAYVWINGRSDLVAGLVLAAFATFAVPSDALRPERDWTRFATIAAAFFFGISSKETFAFAGAGVLLASHAALRTSRRSRARDLVAAFLGGLVHVVLRAEAGAHYSIRTTDEGVPFRLDDLLGLVPRLVTLVADDLFGLHATPMRSLAYESIQPIDPRGLGATIAMFGLIAFAVHRGGRVSAILLVAAAATIAPTVLVSRAIWMGFDRYLYMPLFLFVLASIPAIVWVADRVTDRIAPLVTVAVASWLLAMAMTTQLASRAYQSHSVFYETILAARPNDPTARYARVGCDAHDPASLARIRRELAAMPPFPWPTAALAAIASCASSIRDVSLAGRISEEAIRTDRGTPLFSAYLMQARYAEGRLDEALELAGSLEAASMCAEVRRQLMIWRSVEREPGRRDRIEARLRSIRCANADSRH